MAEGAPLALLNQRTSRKRLEVLEADDPKRSLDSLLTPPHKSAGVWNSFRMYDSSKVPHCNDIAVCYCFLKYHKVLSANTSYWEVWVGGNNGKRQSASKLQRGFCCNAEREYGL